MLKRILSIFPIFSLYFLLSLSTPLLAHAQAQSWGNCVENVVVNGQTSQVPSLQCLPVVFSNVVTAALEFVGAVAVILLVYAGIRFITSGGDAKQVAGARQIITYAIIGLVLVLSSFAIIYLVSYLTGVKCITKLSFTDCG